MTCRLGPGRHVGAGGGDAAARVVPAITVLAGARNVARVLRKLDAGEFDALIMAQPASSASASPNESVAVLTSERFLPAGAGRALA